MEDFKCIADETFPSVLLNSVTGCTSDIFDNITISSTLGIPVAASTEARRKTGSHDGQYDEVSYMDNRFPAPLASSCSGESDSDPRKNLNFQDTVECCNKAADNQLESNQQGSNVLQQKHQQFSNESSGNQWHSLHERLSLQHLEDLTARIFASFEKDNEDYKAVSLEHGQKRITNEIDNNTRIGFSRFIENEQPLSFASLEGHSTEYEIGDEEFCDGQLETYFEQLVLPEMQMEDVEEHEFGEHVKAMELPSNRKTEKFQIPNICQAARTGSPVASDEELYEFKEAGHNEKDKQFMLPVTARQEVECGKPSLNSGHSDSSETFPAEMVVYTSDVCSRTTDYQHASSDALGCHDCSEEDGISVKTKTVSSSRNDATNVTNCELKLDSLYFKCIADSNAASEIWHTEQQTQFPDLSQLANENYVPLADAYLSPSAYKGSEQYECTAEEDPPHDVVYQNEDGRWVTDLAYYTSFNKEQVSNFSNLSGDFVAGSEAIAVIDQDQEEFEREHRFIQEEKMELQNTSGLEDSSWKCVNNGNPLRGSQTDFSKDASYLRLSLGEFFGQRSEALGCLGGGGDVKRPSFGYHITSPEKRQPLPLWRQSDVSRTNTDEQNSQTSTLQGDVEESIKEDSHFASATFTLCEVSAKDREGGREKCEDRKVECKQHEPSILSISTIASAIANASVSTDPAQLAALMTKASNKNREVTSIPGGVKPTDFSAASQSYVNNVENSTFDIEKYLRKTDEVENDGKPESIIKDVATARDLHTVLYKQESELPSPRDLSKSNLSIRHGEEKLNLSIIHEENSYRDSSCKTSFEKKEMECLKAASNIGEDFLPKNLTTSVPDSEKRPSETTTISLEDSGKTLRTYSESEGRTSKNTLPLSLKSVPILLSPLPVHPNKEKTTSNIKYQEKQDEKIMEENAACNNEKRIAFENISVDNQKDVGNAVGVTEQTPTTPMPCMQISDDEQYSFRPSTSPLIHSSPNEATGTALLGADADCPATTSNSKESSCNDSLPQVLYTDHSLGRLTFVSATEKTLQNLTLSSPERCQNNRASGWGTTIVWTSPTSALEEETKKNIDLQNNKHPSLSSASTSARNHNKKLEINKSADASSLPEHQKSTGEQPSKSKDQSAQKCSNSNELRNVEVPVTEHGYTTTAHGPGLDSQKDVPAHGGLGDCISLSQNRANFKSHVPASEIPAISSQVPTLLTGCSLRTTPFAQQYLRSLPSQTNMALPQYQVGCPPVFGVPPGLIYSTIPVGHVPSSLTAGMTPGSEVGSGMLGAAPQCNFISSQNVFSSSPHTVQVADAGGPRQLEESVPFGLERVKVPEEVTFPNACCVGLTSHTVLSILNPSERWLQVSIGLLSIMLDGEKMDPLKHRCFLFKNKTVIGPRTTEDLKMLFLPCQAGVFQCVLSIASWPFTADADTIVQSQALAARVIVNAVAEIPDIEVEAGTTNHLDFGDMPSGSWKALPLKLTNKTCARVPVRLVIYANAVAWRCFTFSKEPVNSSVSLLPTCDISQRAAPSVISHVMNARSDGQDPDVLVVWVQFHAPSKCITSDSLGPADEYFARIDVEVDCPEPAKILSIPLHARSGTPRIYAPKGLQTLYMSARMGLSTRQQLPLKNAGNIKVDLKILALEPDSGISVNPEDLVLIPGEEQEVTVVFSPKDYRNAESVLKILVLPSGPEYKVTVKGEVTAVESKPLVQKYPSSEVPPILANKQFLTWGGVQLGRTVQQKLILRNNSPSITQQLRLLIRGQDQDCFQLKLGEHVYNNCEIKIRPKHDYSVCLMFTPTRLTCMYAKLEMKQLGLLSQLGIKFTIPLYGYGGNSNLRLEDVKKHFNRYIVGLNDIAGLNGKTRQASFSVQNTGSRAAYVKALCFKNSSEIIVMDPNVMRVSPEKFVLQESSQQKVTVTFNSTEDQSNSPVLSTICFVYGDEILRQQYRRAVQQNPEQVQKMLPANNPVINVKFDEEFPGEELVTEVYDLPQHSFDIQYFFMNMRRIIVSAVNAFSSSAFDIKPSSVHRVALERPGVPEKSNMTLDVLPVKGPHGCALSSNADSIDENKLVSKENWTLLPEFLILTAPSQSGAAITKHAQISNNSNRSLTFELSWPAHCLTVTPHHGTIEPGSNISIYVSPNPSLAEKKSIFPWSGLIYVHCDNGQKLVRVQIRENISEKQSETVSPVAKVGVHHQQQPELPIMHIRPLQKPSSTKLEVKNRTVFFPETKSGESSEKYIEIENNGDANVKWLLSSFAPPYIKGLDDSGEVYRATYTAFRCSLLSGILKAHGEEKVVVTFLPRDRGHYSQFWDLECHPLHESHLKDKHRLQFCGMGILGNEDFKNEDSAAALVKVSVRDVTLRRDYPNTSEHKMWKGVHAQEDIYKFPPTRIGESSTLKITVRNYSSFSNKLKFRCPREPFYIKHSHYTLRCHHYCNLPVQFKPVSAGTFKGLLMVETDKSGTLTIQLIGVGLAE
ncbi:centrosomal protein of 192 kDa isoform X1 [Podarcis raffonei]|uniref:centrosomal protein of 192 kDa isoform X1 n=2 Tax=Podarcis raffonei TaxID=65483 RepID=UPI0023290893|nr:centrosomal protein of 192 kDa isoform X1 [Podarcis raffonei]